MDLSYLKEVLHTVSQGLTYPVIALLLLAMVYAVFSIGSVLVEFFVERRHFKVVIPELLQELDSASADEVPDVIAGSGLLLRQKTALVTLYNNRNLPEEARWALAKKLLTQETAHYQRITGRNDTMAKVAPMLGLMGTLIPLGPGIVALGQGETATLAGSLLVAFDTTVAGLVAAAVCLVVSKIRKTWYAEYSAALEAAVTTLLEKMDQQAQRGQAPEAKDVAQAAFESAAEEAK